MEELLMNYVSSRIERGFNSYDALAFRTGNQGMTLYHAGQFREAVTQLKEAIEMRKALNVPEDSEHSGDNNNRIAVLYNAIGSCHTQLKSFTEAEENFLLSIEHRKTTLGPRDYGLVSVHVNLANVYQSQNQAQKAHETLVESISLFHEANYGTCSYNQGKASSANQDKDSIVGALAGLGIQLKNKGDFDSAISAYTTAVDFKKYTGESEDDFSFFSLFINIGMAFKGKREFGEQINWLEKAVVLMEQNRNHPSVSQVYSGVLQHILAAAQQIGDQDRIQIYTAKIGA